MSKNKVAGPTPLNPEPVKAKKQEEIPFEHTHSAYFSYLNPDTKRYDIVKILVDVNTQETQMEFSPQRYDSPHRALLDVVKRVSDDVVKKTK